MQSHTKGRRSSLAFRVIDQPRGGKEAGAVGVVRMTCHPCGVGIAERPREMTRPGLTTRVACVGGFTSVRLREHPGLVRKPSYQPRPVVPVGDFNRLCLQCGRLDPCHPQTPCLHPSEQLTHPVSRPFIPEDQTQRAGINENTRQSWRVSAGRSCECQSVNSAMASRRLKRLSISNQARKPSRLSPRPHWRCQRERN